MATAALAPAPPAPPSAPAAPPETELVAALMYIRGFVARTTRIARDPFDMEAVAIDALAEAVRYYRADRGPFGPFARTAIRRAVWRLFSPNPLARVDVLDGATRCDVDELDGERSAYLFPDPETLMIARETLADGPAAVTG